jgi:hypothetical protein
MSSVDLGKQVGPLPLGAWVAVVGAGLGIAVYTRRQSAASSEPTVVEDTSGVPGVGTGVNGNWTDVTPQPPTDAPTVYTDNDSWARAAIDRLIADGYPAAQVNSAITKALGGGVGDNALSVTEFAIWARALVLLKSPPQPVTVPAPSTTPPAGTPTPTPGTGQRMRMQWVTSKVGVPNESLKTKQTNIAKQAAAAGIWRPSSASLNAIIVQAQIRSGVGSINGILKVGRTVTLYRPVPY